MNETLVNTAVEDLETGMEATEEIPAVLQEGAVPAGMGVGKKILIGVAVAAATFGLCYGVKKGFAWLKNRKNKKAEEAPVEESQQAETEAK